MAKSAAFARIKAQVLDIVATIPISRLSTYQSIGEHLAVMPRHVAYILSQLPPTEKMIYPWHRVVSGDGSLGVAKLDPLGRCQADLLREEGIVITDNRVGSALPLLFISAAELPSGVSKQTRPADVPPAQPTHKPKRLRAAKPRAIQTR
jgi:methylated-DNA-protein-cysteine methyltransferase related protein